jgi:hypothetical protein
MTTMVLQTTMVIIISRPDSTNKLLEVVELDLGAKPAILAEFCNSCNNISHFFGFGTRSFVMRISRRADQSGRAV